MSESKWDLHCDVLVAGSGGAGLVGAFVAANEGLQTIVLESTDKFGGITCYSGGGVWLPGNAVTQRAGVEDSNDQAMEYFERVVGSDTDKAMQQAFVRTGPELVDYMEQNPHLKFEWMAFPDYYADLGAPPAHPRGRDIFPMLLPIAELGELAPKLRLSMAHELGGAAESEPLSGGRALIGRLLLAVASTGRADLRLKTELKRLIVEDGQVVGAQVSGPEGVLRIRARRGVLLAGGGFERNQAMRDAHHLAGNAQWTAGAPGASGGVIKAGLEIGAAIDLMDECWWMPGLLQPYGRAGFIAAVNGGLMVNGRGERFADETMPYDRFGRKLRAQNPDQRTDIRAWWIWDARHGPNLPACYNSLPVLSFEAYEEAGLWKRADTLEELAVKIGVPGEALRKSVERFNQFAETGVDEDFHRGETPYDRYIAAELPDLFGLADTTPVGRPNPCLIPVDRGPFYAAAIGLGDLGTKGGLKTDAHARVLDQRGQPIQNLYAAGNSMASVTGRHYPAPGSPIGTGMVFAYRAMQRLLRSEATASGAGRRRLHSGTG